MQSSAVFEPDVILYWIVLLKGEVLQDVWGAFAKHNELSEYDVFGLSSMNIFHSVFYISQSTFF